MQRGAAFCADPGPEPATACHSRRRAIAVETTTSSGLIIRAPTRIASRAPSEAPATCATAIASPTAHHIAPQGTKTRRLPMFEAKFSIFVCAVAFSTP